MFYLVYKITNTVNGKIYIGAHKTADVNDNYMGSGSILKMAQEKYGTSNFTKEILFVFSSPEEMFLMEAQLVNEDFVSRADTYNLKEGGTGGFGFIHQHNLHLNGVPNFTKDNAKALSIKGNGRKEILHATDPEWRQRYLDRMSKSMRGHQGFLGKTHSAETLEKMRQAKTAHGLGKNNSQFGSFWIYNETTGESCKTKGDIPEGWIRGRKIGTRRNDL